jgi:hypothetical protein
MVQMTILFSWLDAAVALAEGEEEGWGGGGGGGTGGRVCDVGSVHTSQTACSVGCTLGAPRRGGRVW